jgi:hypothetical protein
MPRPHARLLWLALLFGTHDAGGFRGFRSVSVSAQAPAQNFVAAVTAE